MELVLEPVAKDERGESWRILFPDNREALLIFTKAGYYRGGHSHNVLETSMLLTGKLKYWKRFKGQEVVLEKTAGECTVNVPGEVHLALALEDSWLIDWKVGAHTGEWTTTNYEPYRRKVEARL
jgi:quercetin dioxygenase-like cupin family protein